MLFLKMLLPSQARDMFRVASTSLGEAAMKAALALGSINLYCQAGPFSQRKLHILSAHSIIELKKE